MVPDFFGDVAERVLAVSGALRKWGVGKGDRVAILSENRPEWTIADFASLLLGAVTVPIYATLTAEQTAYILSDSGARIVFLSNAAAIAEGPLDSRGRLRWKSWWAVRMLLMATLAPCLNVRAGIRKAGELNLEFEAASGDRCPRFHRTIWPPLSIPRVRPARPRG